MIKVAVFFGLLAFAAANAAPPEIAATKATLRYPSGETVIVKSKNGSAVYRFVIEVVPNVDGTASNLDLVLRPAGAKPGTTNLLDPPGNWHGYQPYFFAASDFQNGPAKSIFGKTRSICRSRTGLIIDITVKDAVVERVDAFTGYQFKSLLIDVVVANAPVSGGRPVCE